MMDDQDKKITLATFLGGIWLRNPFMIELARKMPTTLHEFMDCTDGFINAEDTLRAVIALRKTKVEQAYQKASGSSRRY